MMQIVSGWGRDHCPYFFKFQVIGARLAWKRSACRRSQRQNKLPCEHLMWHGFQPRRPNGGIMMKQSLKLTGLAVLLGTVAAPAMAQEKIKVGIIVTLSGPAAVLG